MPQNYETHNVDLNQRLYEAAVLEMPAYDPPRPGFLRGDKYRVVDVVLRDGREIDGILVIGDTLLLAPDVESFTAEEIVEMTPTPVEKHPDFTITDPDGVPPPGDRSALLNSLARFFPKPRARTTKVITTAPTGIRLPVSEPPEERLAVLRQAGVLAWNGQPLGRVRPVMRVRGKPDVAGLLVEDRD